MHEAISFLVYCNSQDEIDRYRDALSAVPEAEQCGWLADRDGLSWQIVSSNLDEMLQVTKAVLAKAKFDLAELERAYARSATPEGIRA